MQVMQPNLLFECIYILTSDIELLLFTFLGCEVVIWAFRVYKEVLFSYV